MVQAVNISRRNLLQGRATHTPAPLRPPGAISAFADACTACGDCVSACPESIIVAGSGAFPEIDFRRGNCTFCSACIDACEEGALSPAIRPPIQVRLEVMDSCLARRQIVCQSCGDACEAQAIGFPPQLGVVAIPRIDQDACTSCGACINACPEDALRGAASG